MKTWLLALFLAASPLRAGDVSDLILAPGLFSEAPQGEILRYRLTRTMPEAEKAAPKPPAPRSGPAPAASSGGALVLTGERSGELSLLRLSLEANGAQKFLAQFPAEGANPVLLYFLESVVRSTAELTGGSPFYIKNRLLEALVGANLDRAERAPPVSGSQAPAVTVLLLPFEQDPNRGRMGAHAGLRLSLTFDPDQPGRLLVLKADSEATGGGYSEGLDLIAGAK